MVGVSRSDIVTALVVRGSVLRRTGERPVLDADRRDGHPAEEPLERASLASDRDRAAQRIEVALRVAQVPDRPDDPAALDEERAIAGHAGDDRKLGMDGVRVVEAGDQETA